METINTANKQNINKIKKFLNNLESKNIEDYYLESLKKSALTNTEQSGLGLLGILKDYNAKLGIKIESSLQKNIYTVSIKTSIPISEFELL